MKFPFFGLLLLSVSGSVSLAQTVSGANAASSPGLFGAADPSPSPGTVKKTGTDQAPQGPTIIDSNNMDYDEKTRVAIFTGEDYGVFVKDPSFTVYCDKLTAYMRKAGGAAPGVPGAPAAPAPSATPTPLPGPGGKSGAASAAAAKTSGLERAVCEGVPDRPVVIVQDKPGVNGAAPEHNVGIALKADYHADTGDVILTGWPRVSQGINTQIATASYTVMIMNKDGHTMRTIGPSRTIITESEAKTSDAKSKSPTQSPSPSEQ